MKAIVSKDRFWEDLKLQIDIFKPIVNVLRLVDSDMPTMGKVYHAMYTAQEELKEVDYCCTVSVDGKSYSAATKRKYVSLLYIMVLWCSVCQCLVSVVVVILFTILY